MTARLEGKVALVTGGASGMGRASSIRMAIEGASVVIADIADDAAATVVDEIADLGGRSCSVHADVSVEDDVRAAVAHAVDTFGGLHVLHNNAAILTGPYAERDSVVTEIDLEVWQRVIAVDLLGQVLGCKHAIPAMIASGGGSIVNVSTIGTLLGAPGFTAYSVAKGGVNVLTLQVAATYGKLGIRCNTIAPGSVLSPPLRANLEAAPPMRALLEDHHLTPRLGEPEDIAALVAFLASDESGYITGALIPIDGGTTAHMPQLADMQRMKASTG